MDKDIIRIVGKALDGNDLSAAETATLLKIEDLSEEAFFLQHAGRAFSAQLVHGKAEIHGQTGINIAPCPQNCRFCSFAVSNKVFDRSTVDPIEKVIENVLFLEAAGSNAIYLMATADYSFEDFLEISAAVKRAMKTDIQLIANIGDFDEDGAKALRDLGFAGVYHAIRMGEGEVTRIPVERRIKTIEAAHAAGLSVGMCVEPVGPEHAIDELVEKTLMTRNLGAVFSGAMRRTAIPSSPLAKYGTVSYARMANIVAAVALATGANVPGNCTHEPNQLGVFAGANLVWAEVGSNPRDTNDETVRGWTGQRCAELYAETAWDVLNGPSTMFV
jgi:biotin synthase